MSFQWSFLCKTNNDSPVFKVGLLSKNCEEIPAVWSDNGLTTEKGRSDDLLAPSFQEGFASAAFDEQRLCTWDACRRISSRS